MDEPTNPPSSTEDDDDDLPERLFVEGVVTVLLDTFTVDVALAMISNECEERARSLDLDAIGKPDPIKIRLMQQAQLYRYSGAHLDSLAQALEPLFEKTFGDPTPSNEEETSPS